MLDLLWTASLNLGITGSAADVYVGNQSGEVGTILISGGRLSNQDGNIGDATGSRGMAIVSSGTWANSETMGVGLSGTGNMLISGGLVSNGASTIGINATGNGTVTVTSGTWANSSDMTVGRDGTGSLLLNGGVVTINAGSGTMTLGQSIGSKGTLNLGDGSASVGTLNAAVVSGGLGTAIVNFNHTDTNYFFTKGGGSGDAAITLAGNIVMNHTGSGTTTLTGTNTYSGGTNIIAGTLIITEVGVSASVRGTGVVAVDVNGTLAGVGTVLSNTTLAGTLAPGNSPGAMHFGGNLLMASTATVKMELASLASLASFDQISVDGLLTYDGILSITLLGGYFPEINDSFNLFAAASEAGAFDSVVFNVGGYDGTFDSGTGILTITAVPEPTTLALLALSGLLLLRRKRQGD